MHIGSKVRGRGRELVKKTLMYGYSQLRCENFSNFRRVIRGFGRPNLQALYPFMPKVNKNMNENHPISGKNNLTRSLLCRFSPFGVLEFEYHFILSMMIIIIIIQNVQSKGFSFVENGKINV